MGRPHGPQQRPHPILARISRNLFGTLPDSGRSAPKIIRPLTLFLREGRGTKVKKAPFFNNDFEGSVWAPTRPPAKTQPNSCRNEPKLFGHTSRYCEQCSRNLQAPNSIFRGETWDRSQKSTIFQQWLWGVSMGTPMAPSKDPSRFLPEWAETFLAHCQIVWAVLQKFSGT